MAIRISILLVALTLGAASGATAQQITVNLTGGSGALGTLSYVNNLTGPENFTLNVTNLQASTWYSMFLTQGAADGGLPAQLVVSFKTDSAGAQQLGGRVEIKNAFGSANHSANPAVNEDSNGVADKPGAGAKAGGANTNALNYVRIHKAGSTTVFGRSSFARGDSAALTSTTAIP